MAAFVDFFPAGATAHLVLGGARPVVAEAVARVAALEGAAALGAAADGGGVAEDLDVLVAAVAALLHEMHARWAVLVVAVVLRLRVAAGARQRARQEAARGLSSAWQRGDELLVAAAALKDAGDDVRARLAEVGVAAVAAGVTAEQLLAADARALIVVRVELSAEGAAEGGALVLAALEPAFALLFAPERLALVAEDLCLDLAAAALG